MSTANPPGPSTSSAPPPSAAPRGPREIKLVSHSTIFYWWPIWVLGYVFAVMTYFEDHRFAILPAGSKLYETASDDKKVAKYTLVAPKPQPDSKDAPTKSLAHALEASQ